MIAFDSTTETESRTVMMCFLRVDGALFSIEATQVCEVLGEMPSKSVPLAPGYIDGVMPYRGEVLTALSLRRLLGMNKSAQIGCVLVLNDEEANERFGLVVDAIEGLRTMETDLLEPNPASLNPQSMFLFDGLYRTDSALIVRLNTQQMRPSQIAQAGLFDQSYDEKTGWSQ